MLKDILGKLNWQHLAAVGIGLLLALAGQRVGYDFKADLCGQPQPAASSDAN